MPVVGFSVTSVEGRRGKGSLNPQVKINSTPNITAMKEVDLPEIGRKVLSMDFDFVTTYNPDIGSIKISGDLLYVSNDNTKILENWNKNKTIPNEPTVEILNFLFRRCILKILNLSDDLQLPPPISMPFIKLEGQQEAAEAVKENEANELETKDVDEQEKELQDKIKKLTTK